MNPADHQFSVSSGLGLRAQLSFGLGLRAQLMHEVDRTTLAATMLSRFAQDVSFLPGITRSNFENLAKVYSSLVEALSHSQKDAFDNAVSEVRTETFPTLGHISAEAHSDDHHVEVNFNAADWFETASDEAIIALAECGWGGDYPADAVADGLRTKETAVLFDYIETNPQMSFSHDTVGFECNVNESDARAWIAKYRPELLTRLPEAPDADSGVASPSR